MHPLDGPGLKLRRAERQIDDLARVERSYWAGKYYKIIPAEIDAATGEQVYRVLIDAYPSLDWGICIGEIAHNLRSALDGLIWQLALLRTKTPADNTTFPIFLRGTTTRRRNRRRGKGRGQLLPHFDKDGKAVIASLKDVHQAAIEALQPYKRGNLGRHSPLVHLQAINNADKHRLIQVVGARTGAITGPMSIDEPAPDMSGWEWKRILEDGAIIGRSPANMQVEPNIVPSVSFWEGCDAVRGDRVTLTLGRIHQHVHEIVESFRPEFG